MCHPFKRRFLWFTCIISLVVGTSTWSQTSIEEEILESEEETVDQIELAEQLEWLRKHPINLNTADFTTLIRIPLLLPQQAQAILAYRNQLGSFQSLSQLNAIPDLPSDFLEQISPYVRVTAAATRWQVPLHFETRTRIKRQVETPPEFTEGKYFNTPEKVYQRVLINHRDQLTAGVLLERDSGERRLNDFQSYFLHFPYLPFQSELIVGNYTVEIAQGLIQSGAFGNGLSSNPTQAIVKHRRRIKPYRSVSESKSLYGGAWQLNRPHFTGLLLASQTRYDAAKDASGTVTSFDESGLHRTPTEIAKKDQIQEKRWGGSINVIPWPAFQVGATYTISKFNQWVDLSEPIRKRFAFRGQQQELWGLDFNLLVNQLNIFGEWARTPTGESAAQIGAILSFSGLTTTFLFRQYGQQFYNFHGQSFGSFSATPANQKGFYSGISYQINRKTSLKAYFDFYRTPWRTYFETMPIESQKAFVQIFHKLDKSWWITIQWRGKTITKNSDLQRTQSLRWQLDYRLSDRFLIRNRLEKKWTKIVHPALWHQSDTSSEEGWSVYQNLIIKPRSNLSIYTRLGFFDVPTFDTRIFVFENDVPGVMTNRMLFGRGSRWYLLIKYDWFEWLNFALKLTNNFYEDASTNGNSADESNANSINEISLLIDISI